MCYCVTQLSRVNVLLCYSVNPGQVQHLRLSSAGKDKALVQFSSPKHDHKFQYSMNISCSPDEFTWVSSSHCIFTSYLCCVVCFAVSSFDWIKIFVMPLLVEWDHCLLLPLFSQGNHWPGKSWKTAGNPPLPRYSHRPHYHAVLYFVTGIFFHSYCKLCWFSHCWISASAIIQWKM